VLGRDVRSELPVESTSLSTICYGAALPMTKRKRKTPKTTVATADLDPATLASQKRLKLQRQQMSRALLKRRRRKSGQ
jgi:hypothetical protein